MTVQERDDQATAAAGSSTPAVPEVPPDCERVMVASTASSRGLGIRRLPDRTDQGGSLVAFQVETSDDARHLLARLDRSGRQIYLDVEAKQDLDLLSLAADVVRHAAVHTMKPNDATVDATEAFVLHHYGIDLRSRSVAVYGTGNLGFKIALRLAERGARVQLFGRNGERVAQATAAINAILPRHTRHRLPQGGTRCFDTLISAVSGRGAVGTDWLERLGPESLVIDVGINNLTAALIAAAHDQGHLCVRLDVRAAPYPVPPARNAFFESVLGRSQVAGVPVVAGGLIGRPGEVVVDQVPQIRQVVGVADGTGGLVPAALWSPGQREEVAAVEAHIGATSP